jgi:hypothetical protein
MTAMVGIRESFLYFDFINLKNLIGPNEQHKIVISSW